MSIETTKYLPMIKDWKNTIVDPLPTIEPQQQHDANIN
jgi:hypothetical protein